MPSCHSAAIRQEWRAGIERRGRNVRCSWSSLRTLEFGDEQETMKGASSANASKKKLIANRLK
jgi:hypothetical protein